MAGEIQMTVMPITFNCKMPTCRYTGYSDDLGMNIKRNGRAEIIPMQ